MIPEFGHMALILALCFAFLQFCLPCYGVWYQQTVHQRSAFVFAYAQCFFLTISFACLSFTFLSNDFSVAYVAINSHSAMPMIYRFTALWGAHEGSLLLWTFLLSLWTIALCLWPQRMPLSFRALQIALLGLISSGFLLFILATSNPFLRLLPESPIQGQGLNPLLQDPGLVSHPPILYMGYVGFAVTFSFAVVAMLYPDKKYNAWLNWMRPWAMAAWCFLTLGITLGSWWAYHVLGWGGWWFWDPVENASLMPWLAGTALLHALIISQRQAIFSAWSIFLAILCFSLSLLGTFLVRSGVLTSVHAFANDPGRGIYLLVFLFIIVAGSLLLFAVRAPHSLQVMPKFQFFNSRFALLLFNNVIVLTALVIILLGTLYPLILDALHLGKISIGAPYFSMLFYPLSLLLLFLLAWVLPCGWLVTTKTAWLKHALLFIIALLTSTLTIANLQQGFSGKVCLGLTLCYWVIISTLVDVWQRRQHSLTGRYMGMVIAHTGVAVCALGVIIASHYTQTHDVRMLAGDNTKLAGYQFQFLGTRPLQGSNYQGIKAGFLVSHNQQNYLIEAERRVYTNQQTSLMQAGIHLSLWRDIYISLGDGFSDGSWAVRVAVKPMVRWIWLGGILMLCGGIVTIVYRRRDA